MTRLHVVVPAAGGGTRSGSAMPKQYRAIAGRPMLAHTLDRLAVLDARTTIVALAPDDRDYGRLVGERPGVEAIHCGGPTRARTVANALVLLASRAAADDWVLVHDAARPCVPVDALARLVAALADDPVGGLLAIPVADTIKRADGGAPPRVGRTEDRRALWQAQTPQMFRYALLAQALAAPNADEATDEAQAIEAMAADGRCAMPRLVEGSRANIKVTYPDDWAIAEAILSTQRGIPR
ncbi:MAG: 2-C-methyl-D-erythritol 4-phosphate cytidylyltransferase [Burkholderiales bacterium]